MSDDSSAIESNSTMTIPRQHNRHNDSGETLIEVLCTIIIIGSAISALVAGLGSTALNTLRHRDQATANTVLRSYAEALKQTTTSEGFYTNCRTTPYAVPASLYTLPTGWTAPTNVVTNPCSGAGPDPGTQQVRITIVTPRNVTQALDIWVRSPNA
jgi:type II secretory pathway pseudopilin PulG